MRSRILLPLLRQRYLVDGYGPLIDRVSSFLSPDDRRQAAHWASLMDENRIWPAGNTLLAGSGEPVRPNCCILPSPCEDSLDATVARARRLWAARIGIGFDLSGCRDPVAVLQRLSAENASVPMEHRPQRGNMATLAITHPEAAQFARAKGTLDDAERLYNFNISLAVDGDSAWHAATEKGGVLDVAADACWRGGDPGIVFLDAIRAAAPYDYNRVSTAYGPLETVVPCGEQAMHANETCSLAAVNLNADAHWLPGGQLDEHSLAESVQQAVLLLMATRSDRIMDYAGDEALREASNGLNRIGLGVLGWADVLSDRLPRGQRRYGGPESIALAARIGAIYRDVARGTSQTFGARRPITTTCMQPTGGITLLAQQKGFGIEPHFGDEVSVASHLDMVAAWQPYVDNAISKTINLPEDASHADVRDAFVNARRLGLKLVSVYRTGSRSAEPMASTRNRKRSCSTC